MKIKYSQHETEECRKPQKIVIHYHVTMHAQGLNFNLV